MSSRFSLSNFLSDETSGLALVLGKSGFVSSTLASTDTVISAIEFYASITLVSTKEVDETEKSPPTPGAQKIAFELSGVLSSCGYFQLE